jgi:hypothetical protein
MLVEQSDPDRRTMSAYQPDTEAGRHSPEAPPSFRMVRRAHDRDEVDACFSQLAERPQEAVDQYARAEQAKAEPQGEVTSLREGLRWSRVENGRRRARRSPRRPGSFGRTSPMRLRRCWSRPGRTPSRSTRRSSRSGQQC